MAQRELSRDSAPGSKDSPALEIADSDRGITRRQQRLRSLETVTETVDKCPVCWGPRTKR